jgi:hypothetical protein
MDVFQLRMVKAALQQALRDRLDWLTQKEVDEILDQISTLAKIIEELERKH